MADGLELSASCDFRIGAISLRHRFLFFDFSDFSDFSGIKQPHVSSLMRGQSGNFSVERLMDFLTALGRDVEIKVRPTRKEHGDVLLVLA
jgi:hypothetical protein